MEESQNIRAYECALPLSVMTYDLDSIILDKIDKHKGMVTVYHFKRYKNQKPSNVTDELRWRFVLAKLWAIDTRRDSLKDVYTGNYLEW